MRTAEVRRYEAKVIPFESETEQAARARLEEAWPGMLATLGVQQVGTAVGEESTVYTIRHDRPGDEPKPYPFEVRMRARVIDAAVPAEIAARLPAAFEYVQYETDPEETP